jgi:hypothetical protein
MTIVENRETSALCALGYLQQFIYPYTNIQILFYKQYSL